MMSVRVPWLASLAVLYLAVLLTGAVDPATTDALKVEHLLKTIETHPDRSADKDLTAEVTEQELNAYIAYRLAREKGQPIDRLKVRLLDRNRIHGKIRLDAAQLNLGVLLGDDLDFDFEGLVHSRNGAVRLELAELRLRGHPMDPQLADMILDAASLCTGTQLGRIGDWYAMPKGIKQITVTRGKAVVHY